MASPQSSVPKADHHEDYGEAVVPVANHIRRTEDATIRVLHVDDDPEFSAVTSTFLEQVDDSIAVTTEDRAQDALDHYRRKEGVVECIVSDFQMPEMDGLDFLERIRAEHPDVPFILFTGKGSEEVASDAIAAGVTEYMQKGAGADTYRVLANRIRNAVEQYRSERAFQTTLSWYQRLCEQSLAGTYLIHDYRYAYVNQKFANVFGYTQDELIGEDPLNVVVESDRDLVRENLRKRIEGEQETIRYQFTGLKKDGETVEIDVHGGTIDFGGDPAVLGVITESSR